MESVKKTIYYQEALHELNYSFGNYFLFDRFVIGEVKEDVVFTWEDQGKKLVENLTGLYGNNSKDIVFISHRINDYAVVPSDWIQFFRNSHKLKGYAIVTYTQTGFLNALLEKLFVSSRFKRFRTLDAAITWAKTIANHENMVS